MEREIAMGAAVDAYLQHVSIGSPGTLKAYRSALKTLSGLASLDMLTRARCVELVERYARDHAPESTRSYAYRLSAFGRWCAGEGLLPANPAERIPKPRHQIPQHRYWSRRQIAALLAAARDDTDRIIVRLIASTGLRVGELCGLRWPDVAWDEGVVRFRGKGAKPRELAIDAATLALLARNRDTPPRRAKRGPRANAGHPGRIVPMTTNSVRYRLAQMARRAGIAGVTPHQGRHAFAVAWLEETDDAGSLQELLGHADAQMTRWYVRTVRQRSALRKQRTVNLAARLFGPPELDEQS